MIKTSGKGYGLTFDQEVFEVTTIDESEPDPEWEYTDPAGHVHRYDEDFEVPTARWIATGSWYCESCEDTHVEYDLRCAACLARIRPGTRQSKDAGCRSFMAGMMRITGWVSSENPAYRVLAAHARDDPTAPLDFLWVGSYGLLGVRLRTVDAERIEFEAEGKRV